MTAYRSRGKKYSGYGETWTESDSRLSSITIATTMIFFLFAEVFVLISVDVISCVTFLVRKFKHKLKESDGSFVYSEAH